MEGETLIQIDSHHQCRQRGTWFSDLVKKWFELDVFVCGGAAANRFGAVKTRAQGELDHKTKLINYFPEGTEAAKRRHRIAMARGELEEERRQCGPIRWEKTKGDTEHSAELCEKIPRRT